MIFVTVGTHEQQFNRLIECVDNLKRDGIIVENVIIQSGYSTYIPQHCDCNPFFPYEQMIRYVEEANIIITHGGPSSFIMPLQIGKIPIVVPRQKVYGEHVNDHQVNFASEVASRMGTIISVVNIRRLEDTILNYSKVASEMNSSTKSNNSEFNTMLSRIVGDLIK